MIKVLDILLFLVLFSFLQMQSHKDRCRARKNSKRAQTYKQTTFAPIPSSLLFFTKLEIQKQKLESQKTAKSEEHTKAQTYK